MQPSISVVHLIWIPYGIQLFKDFVDSYKLFPAGHEHHLILLFNGVTDKKQTDDYHAYIQNTGIPYQSFYYSTGQDLEVYQKIAGQLSCNYILFLNSYSRFKSDNWLQKFVSAVIPEDTGLVGATGSWLSLYSSVFKTNNWRWTRSISLKQNLDKYIVLAKATLLWHRYYRPFPNPHVRTNAFIINRKLFCSIQYPYPQTKYEAYRIESGRKSITQQVLKRNLKVLLIDKNGNTFEANKWNTIKIFWRYDQEDLLVSDNQTDSYSNSNTENKKLLEKLAWGGNGY